MNPFRRCGCVLACVLACAGAGGEEAAAPLTGILGALSGEVMLIEKEMSLKQEQTLLGLRFAAGELRGRNVVVARSGVGKVNAAMAATLLLDHFHPSEVLFSGIAGGLGKDLQPGDIVVGEKTAQHDAGRATEGGFVRNAMRNPVDGKRNPLMIEAEARLLALAEKARDEVTLEKVVLPEGGRVPRILRGIIVSGDSFIASSSKKNELREALQADAVEMEGAAVAQVCYQQKVPCLVVRSLSDSADENAHVDAAQFEAVAAHNSAVFVLKIVELLAKR